MSTSANTVSFRNLMGTILISVVLATPPTPFAHTGIHVIIVRMTTLLIPQRFNDIAIRSKLRAPQVEWPAPVSTRALPAGSIQVKEERSPVVAIITHDEV